ncbi:MAG: zf-HC2 domain-containing protein [Pyrinomonadaceae bacterium]|jgi:hypothetical protein|nr:zf-HC2 domain-containing protein [Pyrinomonadaceae bacterium]
MKCNDLQNNLALYIDDFLDKQSLVEVEVHLNNCLDCQKKLDQFKNLQFNLRELARPNIPNDLAFSVQSAVTAQLNNSSDKHYFSISSDTFEFLKFKVMPYTVATFASLLLSFSLLYSLFTVNTNIENSNQIAQNTGYVQTKVLIAPNSKTLAPQPYNSETSLITPEEYAYARLNVSGESPSINPTGALIALTKSMARGGQLEDDEIVVVADVFSNGLAKISKIVQAPKSDKSAKELEKALSSDPDFAPFVISTLDKRSDTMQIVLKIQQVEVEDTPK